jgi:predicted phage terminase large subunit-like protein
MGEVDFTREELETLLNNVDALDEQELAEIERMLDELNEKQALQTARDDLIAFCLRMDPNYKVGRHHRILADVLMGLEQGSEDRACVNIPPRHGKSQLVSIYYPAWFIGRNPNKKVMMVSHTTDLAVDFGRKVRNLIDTETYKEIFPAVALATDSKSAGRWNTNFGGEYFACGVGSALAGRGADLLLVDDPHSEQDVLSGNFSVFEKAYQWFTYGARTRLMPGGRVAIVQCMVGDTPVLRPDGSETLLRDIRPGDVVASYKDGRVVGRKILNKQSNGLDDVFTIKTTSHTVEANRRHPFLVVTDEGLQWKRVQNLRVGDTLVSLKGATGPVERFSATTATLPLGIPNPEKRLSPLPSISDFTLTTITGIEYSGRKEVFDVQVEDTENFIANGLVSHNTRWHQDDLTGRVTRDMVHNDGADQYKIVEFPAILEREGENGELIQKALWPEFFDLQALLRTKASMPVFQWNSQYQQSPTAEEAAVVKREWWQLWADDDPPACEYIIMSLDAAAETNNRADFTALTVWGVFLNEGERAHHIILLNAVKRRLEFPELKQLCLDEYNNWEPDSFIVEKKSAGTAVFQELRRMGIPVQEYTPHRGTGDKMARLNSVSDIIASGFVWVPPTRWAEEVVEEVAGFPFASHDDLVDSTVMALLRFRQGGFIRLPTDEIDDEPVHRLPQEPYY